MPPKKKEPICSNCYECGHIGKNCPDRPFVFYSNRKFPDVTRIKSKSIPKKIKDAHSDCSLCGQPLNSKDKTVVETACKHYFHNECLAIRWKEERPKTNCPTCDFDYTIDMGDGEIEITPNANDVFRRSRAENQYAYDIESQKRNLTYKEIEQILRQEGPFDDKDKDFLRKQLKTLTYDKDYHGYYTTDVSIGLYDQARDRIQEWKRGGTEEDHFQPADKDALAALSESLFQKTHPELVRNIFGYIKPEDDPNVKEFYDEQLKNPPPTPPAKSNKSRYTAKSSKKPPSFGGAKTKKRRNKLVKTLYRKH
jgi:hypothetical protein